MKKMEVVTMPIADLVMADYNPRTWSPDERKALRTSLERFGFVEPVLVNTHPKRKNLVVGGHFRVSMWKEMGNTEVPCVLIKLDEKRERELNVRLNKNTGSWDFKLLEQFYQVEDLLDFGFETHELPNAVPLLTDAELEAFLKEKSQPSGRKMITVALHFTEEEHPKVVEAQKKDGRSFEDIVKQALSL